MWQMVFAHISVQGWIIDPYVYSLYFDIVGREDLNQMRTIKEAIYIRVNDPSLNRNVGKYHLPHVWDEVLANISELKLK